MGKWHQMALSDANVVRRAVLAAIIQAFVHTRRSRRTSKEYIGVRYRSFASVGVVLR